MKAKAKTTKAKRRAHSRDKATLAYRVDGCYYCPACGVPPRYYPSYREICETVKTAPIIIETVTDVADLYDVDMPSDHYQVQWAVCTTCGESLKPEETR